MLSSRVIDSVSKLCSKLQRLSVVCRHNSVATGVRTESIVPFKSQVPYCVFGVTKLNTDVSLKLVSQSTSVEYKCPSLRLPRSAIVDVPQSSHVSYKCPNESVIAKEVVLPNSSLFHFELPPSDRNSLSKEAKNILKIRHRMRKKHRRRKLRKVGADVKRRKKEVSKYRQMTRRKAVAARIEKKGVDFNAEEYLKSVLHQARLGGYQLPIALKKK